MKTLSTHELLENLNRRYAVKQFDPTKKVDDVELNTILDSFHLAPSSSNIQPWGLVVVTDPEIRKQLQTHAYGQSQIIDASHLLVLCRRTQIDEARVDGVIDTTAAARGLQASDLDGLKQMQMGIIGMLGDQLPCWAANQVSLAAGCVLSACASLGVDACPMGGLDPTGFDQILGLDDKHLATVMAIAIGYRSPDDKYATAPKARLSKEDVIFFE